MAEKKDNDTVASDTVNAYRAQQAKAKTPSKPKYDNNKESVDNDMLAGEMAHPSGKKAGGSCKGYAKGGSASSRGDGCATKGHTKGAMR